MAVLLRPVMAHIRSGPRRVLAPGSRADISGLRSTPPHPTDPHTTLSRSLLMLPVPRGGGAEKDGKAPGAALSAILMEETGGSAVAAGAGPTVTTAKPEAAACCLLLVKKFVAEVVATFLLVATVGLAVGQDEALAPLAIGASVWCAKFAFAHVSGAHINPAVTLGVFIRGGICIVDALAYVVAQFIGAFLAAFTSNADFESAMGCVNRSGTNTGSCGFGFPNVNPRYDDALWVPLAMEAIFTFFIITVALNTQGTRALEGNSYYGLAIGSMVMVGVLAVGDISGGAFNPALGTALPVVAGDTQYVWLYWVGPLLGSAVGGALFFVTSHPSEFQRTHLGCVLYGDVRCCCSRSRVRRDSGLGSTCEQVENI